jgi:hypothetical protein
MITRLHTTKLTHRERPPTCPHDGQALVNAWDPTLAYPPVTVCLGHPHHTATRDTGTDPFTSWPVV